jgi:hypothetical protein
MQFDTERAEEHRRYCHYPHTRGWWAYYWQSRLREHVPFRH